MIGTSIAPNGIAPHARKSCCRSTGVRKATPVAYRKLEPEISIFKFSRSQRSPVLTDVPTLQPLFPDLRSLAGDAWLAGIPPHAVSSGKLGRAVQIASITHPRGTPRRKTQRAPAETFLRASGWRLLWSRIDICVLENLRCLARVRLLTAGRL